jgi:hypothetical protein
VVFDPSGALLTPRLVTDPELSPLDLKVAPNGNIVVASEWPFGAADAVPSVREYNRKLYRPGRAPGSAQRTGAGPLAYVNLSATGAPDNPGLPRAAGQARGLFTSSGTDSALIASNEIASGGVTTLSVQSPRTLSRLPDIADR